MHGSLTVRRLLALCRLYNLYTVGANVFTQERPPHSSWDSTTALTYFSGLQSWASAIFLILTPPVILYFLFREYNILEPRVTRLTLQNSLLFPFPANSLNSKYANFSTMV